MPKRNLKNLKLRAIACVDNPCQEHALALTIKRYDDPETTETADFLAKYVCETDGAHSFAEVLQANRFSEKIWPCVDAFAQSIRSIVGDKSLTGAARAEKIGSSTGEFLAAVSAISPEVSKRLGALVRKKEEGPMAKTVEELQAEVDKLTGQLTSANALVTSEKNRAETEKARADGLQTQLDAEKTAHGTTKDALTKATDETITVGGQEIKKSVVGDAQFSVLKSLRDERDTATFEKRAETELAHVVGKPSEKAMVLKHLSALPEDSETRKAAEAIIQSAEKMAAQGFATLGHSNLSETTKAAVQKFEEKVDAVIAAEKIDRSEAMSKVRRENPELFAEYQASQG